MKRVMILAVGLLLPPLLFAGNVQPRVVGGEELTDAPSWMLWVLSSQGSCGGSLISPQWVLTAAHCVDKQPKDIALTHSVADLSAADAPSVKVSDVIIHPEYQAFTDNTVSRNDLALLKLQQPLDLDPLPILELNRLQQLRAGDRVDLYGWGRTGSGEDISRTLKKAQLQYLPAAQCKLFFAGLDNLQLCASAARAGGCQGDSGGPLVSLVNDQPKLLGVVSFGSKDCQPGKPEVFAAVPQYYQWIANKTGAIKLEGPEDLGFIGTNRTIEQSYRLSNETIGTVAINEVLLAGSAAFKLKTNECITSLATGESCVIRLTVSANQPGKLAASIRLRLNDELQGGAYPVTATVLGELQPIPGSLQLSGVDWFVGTNPPWQLINNLATGSQPGFQATDDGQAQLLLHVQGPTILTFTAVSAGSSAFDGLMLTLNHQVLRWQRISSQPQPISVRIPSGSQRLLLSYSKLSQARDGSRANVYDFKMGAEAVAQQHFIGIKQKSTGGSLDVIFYLWLVVAGLGQRRLLSISLFFSRNSVGKHYL